jgi:hypothetical protein
LLSIRDAAIILAPSHLGSISIKVAAAAMRAELEKRGIGFAFDGDGKACGITFAKPPASDPH